MPGRRRRARCIGFDPGVLCFKPCGRPGRGLATVELRADELEALRLADLEGLYQEACATRMGISRTTLSRTLAAARRKVTDALLNGKRLVLAPVDRDDATALAVANPAPLQAPNAFPVTTAAATTTSPPAPLDNAAASLDTDTPTAIPTDNNIRQPTACPRTTKPSST